MTEKKAAAKTEAATAMEAMDAVAEGVPAKEQKKAPKAEMTVAKKSATAKKAPKPADMTGSVSSVLVHTDEDKLAMFLPPEMQDSQTKKIQFLRALGAHIMGNPSLRQKLQSGGANKVSLLQAAGEAATFGFLLGHHAHLIPYSSDVTMVPDYKGVLDLWRRDPDYFVWIPEMVRAKDGFSMTKGIRDGRAADTLEHGIPPSSDRGDIVGGYIRWSHRGVADYLYMTRDEFDSIKKIADDRSRGKSKVWADHYEAMCIKTLIKRAAKYGNTSPQVAAAADRLSVHEPHDSFAGGGGKNTGTLVPPPMEHVPATATDLAEEEAQVDDITSEL